MAAANQSTSRRSLRSTARPSALRRLWPVAYLLCLGYFLHSAAAADQTTHVEQTPTRVSVTWPISPEQSGHAVFNLDPSQPLITSLGLASGDAPPETIATGLDPVTLLTIGERDLKNPAGWVAFFDDPPLRPHKTVPVVLGPRAAKVTTTGTHTTVRLAAVTAGSFHGDLRVTFYDNSPLLHVETVLSTEEPGRAILYDTGLTSAAPAWRSLAWHDTTGQLQRAPLDPAAPAVNLAVAGRTLAAETPTGSLAVFPPPHQFFYPLDEAFNLQFLWHGRNYGHQPLDPGFGIRQPPTGDKRHVPWFNAPPDTEQHLGVFYLLSSGPAEAALARVARFTRHDHYEPLPGYLTYTSHYHIEHTFEFLRRQKEEGTAAVPAALQTPGFVKTFKARGVNVVHLAEFHAGPTPDLPDEKRLPLLQTLHAECARLSDADLLVLPGEEPNVHLGGHWLSLFPKPVYWVLNRSDGVPFARETPGYGTVYHVGNAADVLQLMEREHGLMWTAHPRIKASIGFPDQYKNEPFFRSDHFLGAAWKAMPADLSLPRLGVRALDLLDDMSNWGLKKQLPGEADLFRMEPDFETYGHLNVNYLHLAKLPRFNDGWQPILDTLRNGDFFTTTGEVLIPTFTVGNHHAGETLPPPDAPATLDATLAWTFPLSFAEVISGDGNQVYRQRIDLTDTQPFGTRRLQIPLDLKGRTWVRLEVWDIAVNGAYTQPIWIAAPSR